MEEVIKQISMLHQLYLICLIGMIGCFVISIILFRKLQIKEVVSFFRRQNTNAWRKKRRTKILLVILCGLLAGAFGISAEAAQDTESAESTEEEMPENMAPVLKTFVIQSGSEIPEDALVTDDGIFYYARNLGELEDIKIEVSICDDAETFDSTKVLLEYRVEGQEKWTLLMSEQQEWTSKEQGEFETIYLFDGAEGQENIYSFRISYVDVNGNALTLGENVPAEGEQGTFVSTQKIVIDKVSPSFQAGYHSETGDELQSNEEGTALEPYFNGAREVFLNFQAAEQNLDYEKTTIKVSALDRNNNLLENVEEAEKYSKTWSELSKEHIVDDELQTFTLKLTSDAHYIIEIKLVDKAGNETVHQKTFALDYGAPEIADITCTLENGDPISRLINQLTFGYFAKEKTLVHIKASDLVSGVEKISYTYEDVDTKEIVTETVEVQESDVDKNVAELTVELPFSFKGTVKAYGIDKLENTADESSGIGVIAESQEKHEDSSSASVNVKTSHSKTKNYYSGDVEVTFAVQDTYSGVNSVSYIAGDGEPETVSYENETEIVTSKLIKDDRIFATENQKNNVVLGLEFTDNAGHTTSVPKETLPKIHIDTIKPKVRVVYDNYDARNEKYYCEMRTATVYVTERNFDPEDVHFELSGPTPAISGWSHTAGAGCTGNHEAKHTGHTDECMWKCSVEFKEDGDYRFGFHCIDLAGNEGRYEQTDEFVIDKTTPVLKVNYDNQNVQNEIYYNAPRTATITIEEHNFEPSEAAIVLTAKNNGAEIELPAVSTWSSTGDVHRAVIHYNYDGAFTFDIVCVDLAGNESADYPGDNFVIDLTVPEITISEVFDHSANNGTVSPLITISDTNYEGNQTNIQIEGWYYGSLEASISKAPLANGEVIRIQDFEHVKEKDDLYKLTVLSIDLAGNAAEKSITFSVNRFGSVYTFDEETEKLAGENGSYYTNQEIPLVITETNVDTLVHQEIICNLNGKLKTLIKGVDYRVRESGNENTWKQYEYDIEERNFAEEGHYILTIYSEDRAENVSDNHSKGKTIAFAVDKTNPSILISGVEEKGQYRENRREITVDVQDNLELSEVKIYLDKKEFLFSGAEVAENDGKITVTAESASDWQTIQVFSKDMAGNEVYSKEITFLVTPNIFVQFYRNTELLYGSFLCISLCVGSIVFWRYKRKKIV